jgi:hypothetical protein
LEENLAEKDVILVRRQTSLQNLSEEFLKGNEIIKILQKDIATLKSMVCVCGIKLENKHIYKTK